jgi:hypothetical protein
MKRKQMSESKKERSAKSSAKANAHKSIFYENPYDVETFFEGLEIAAQHDKELHYVDRFIANLRLDPLQDTSDVVFKVLNKDLDLVKFVPK